MAEKYMLRVTAGPSYDPSTHVVLPVNTPQSTRVAHAHCTAQVQVSVQNYRGLPSSSPSTSPYFSHPRHEHDQYSIAFAFTPHESISGTDLVFGNDFDRPIRDRLPPGFGAALRIVRWAIDPGLEGDPYSDNPYLYGPLLSSVNVLNVGGKAGQKGGDAEKKESGKGGAYEVEALGEEVVEEGAEGDDAVELREQSGCPGGSAERQKWALGAPEKDRWVWEGGRTYRADFSNGYLDFNEFALRLPGFSMGVLPYLGGKDDLRYVLKNKTTGDVFFVVVFTLVLKEDVEKEEAEQQRKDSSRPHAEAAEKVQSKGAVNNTSAEDLD